RCGPVTSARVPARDAAWRELARRYAAGHAPAGDEDFARWSGLPTADVRTDRQDAPSPHTADTGVVRLLPAFDEWLLGWASRSFALPDEHAKRAAPGGGII